MGDITSKTTAAELVAAFGFSSVAQMEAYLKRHKTKGSKGSKSSDEAVVEMAAKVWEVIQDAPSNRRWKSGTLTTLISKGELIKANDYDPELKKRRYAMHALIGKALKHLHAEGAMEKPEVRSATQTHYLRIEGASFGEQAEPEILGLPGPAPKVEEEIIDAEIVAETPKPKARVRRRSKKK